MHSTSDEDRAAATCSSTTGAENAKQVIVPVMKSSVMSRSKKLSNWLSLRLARARISIFLSGLPVSAISSSTTAANLKQCDESEVIHT